MHKSKFQIIQIIEIINQSGYVNFVIITLDSCYSGKMCYEAKDYFDKKRDQIKFSGIKVHAFTHKSKKAVWGKNGKIKNQAEEAGRSYQER